MRDEPAPGQCAVDEDLVDLRDGPSQRQVSIVRGVGLVELVAASEPDRIAELDDALLDGTAAERWLVRVPTEEAARKGTPSDLPDAEAIRLRYGVSEIKIEVWLVDGALRRLRYALSRDQAPNGGPDRTTTTYDWQPVSDFDPIVIPEASGT
jgi:hypothetical protein